MRSASIAITPKYVHITHFVNNRPIYTKSFRNDQISQYSRNRVYRLCKANAVSATINKSGTTQYKVQF